MRLRPVLVVVTCLLFLAGALTLWHAHKQSVLEKKLARRTTVRLEQSSSTAPNLLAKPTVAANVAENITATVRTNPFAYRLSNTTKSVGQLITNPNAVLLENALIDTSAKMDLSIPKHLQSQGDPGAYIVQAHGAITPVFRKALSQFGAKIVSYIPNNAYLVNVSAGGADAIRASGYAQSVIPYEPYYKLQPSLIGLAAENKALPPGTDLNIGLFANASQVIEQIEKAGGKIVSQTRSPFGPVVRVQPPQNWTALATLAGVQIVEPYRQRAILNDLTRATVGVSADTQTITNYLDLSGSNVVVEVNDSGIDAQHPDFGTGGGLPVRVFAPTTNTLVDTEGHGTHVAGIIAGDGTQSLTVTNAEGSIMPATNGQFRGKAPLAHLLSMSFFDDDAVLQETAVRTNAIISNNSWGFPADNFYDLAAASYDAATRDSLPGATGSQPVLYVFSAGNSGGGGDDGGGGFSDTIVSPATAKDVIAVGALESLRNITNVVTDVNSNQTQPWLHTTDTSQQVAGFSSRGNVGIGVEGDTGRFKPDVVAPGVFIISTRSEQWATNLYYSSTNSHITQAFDLLDPGAMTDPLLDFFVYTRTVRITIQAFSGTNTMPIYVWNQTSPNGTLAANNFANIPPDMPLTDLGTFWQCAASNITDRVLPYGLTVNVQTTNDLGDYFPVLEAMNDSLGGWYRYESGTSMSAPAVSGTLALMADFFTNRLAMTPSPALLKAMLINGARRTSNYDFDKRSPMNIEGWGLINLPNSLPVDLASNTPGSTSTLYFLDQSPTNALATGDTQTFGVTVSTNASESALRVTLAWTDPPGNPAAAVKLVNNLDLVVSNLDTGETFFGNDFGSSGVFTSSWATNQLTNAVGVADVVNNIENVYLPAPLGGHYIVSVIGREVNVNAVTAHTNSVVQDFALVISTETPGGISVTNGAVTSLGDYRNETFVMTTNQPLLHQYVGATSPLFGTNEVSVGNNALWPTNGEIVLGATNQWHFYVVTNNTSFTNAAFITFLPNTLAIPREGVFANTDASSTRPEADIDLYVARGAAASGLTNLDPSVINVADRSLGRGGTEFVVYTNSTPGEVFYIGVKSEDRMGSEYAFIPIFTDVPFGQSNGKGDQYVNGLNVPVTIPDGDNTRPGVAYVFAIALQPEEIQRVVVTNTILHQNFGDLVGTLTHANQVGGSTAVVLNSHEEPTAPPPGPFTFVYDDSGRNDIVGSVPTAGPTSLNQYTGNSALGLWILTEMDNSLTQTGVVENLSLFIEKHQDPRQGITVSIPPGGWFYTYVDVPAGFTNLQVFGTNLPPTSVPPIQMYLRLGATPDANNFDLGTELTNGVPPGNVLSDGPPLFPGRYFIGLFNPDAVAHDVYLLAQLNGALQLNGPSGFNGAGTALADDAVNASPTVFVDNTNTISSVNVGFVVQHPRISDLAFTLVSPTGHRILLMENRGGSDTNGAGTIFTFSNIVNSTANGGAAPNTNSLAVAPGPNSLSITYNFYTVQDEMTVYAGTNSSTFTVPGSTLLWDTGFTNNPPIGPGAQNTQPVTINVPYPAGVTNVTIIMNQFGNPFAVGGDAWTYTAGAAITNYTYLMFTEDTNLATLPIKYAPPPFSFTEVVSNYTLTDFERATNGNYFAPTNIYDPFGGWSMPTNRVLGTNTFPWASNMVSVVFDPANSLGDNIGSNFLALANGAIERSLPTVPNKLYNVTFWYRGPGIAGWWRGEGDATDNADSERLGLNGSLIGRFDFPQGVVGQAFQMENTGDFNTFAGTNGYVQVQVHESTTLDVGAGAGLTVEGWINPTNVFFRQPLVEWLARVPTNSSDTNLYVEAGPFLNVLTGHYYYMLGPTNWRTSEIWATNLGGHLVTINTANEENWVYDTFANFNGTNHNMWIGLTNNHSLAYGWANGETNVSYTNWISGQPNNCTGTKSYTFMYGLTNASPGLWTLADFNGIVCSSSATNKVYGIVEVEALQTNGVQLWISTTNIPGTTNTLVSSNGCLYANLVDITNGWHQIWTPPGLVQSNVYQHIALTYDTNSGLASFYYNGTNVVTTNLGAFVPKTTGDVLLGKDMSPDTNNFYGGEMDEMSIYGRALSAAEIAAIYQLSVTSTNTPFGNTNNMVGKFDPASTPPFSLAEAKVVFGTTTNVIFGLNNQWSQNSFTFVATSNSMPFQLFGVEPGMLLDSFAVSQTPLTNLYYIPEQSLDDLKGESGFGEWTLEVWDNRAGAVATNAQLVSWQLQLQFRSNNLPSVDIPPNTPVSLTVPPGRTIDLTVDVPSWAILASNLLLSADYPVDMYFNQNNPPTGTGAGDYTLIANQAAPPVVVGNPVLTVNPPSTPPLVPNQRYYLGVHNGGIHAASVTVEVVFNVTGLTNDIPFSSTLATNEDSRYFYFDVSSNAVEATFQLLDVSNNVDLVVRKGSPLPSLFSSDYGSFNVGSNDENIYVRTNSAPVALSPGRWYIGVIKRDANKPVNYTLLAKELKATDIVTVINLTNGVPFTCTADAGADLTNYFHFKVSDNTTNQLIGAVRFEVFHATGNVDLTVQTNGLPSAPPFFQTSEQTQMTPEIIFIRTNTAATGTVLTNLFTTDWYLGVPNHETNLVSYTIVASLETNAGLPAFLGAEGFGAVAIGGRYGDVYHVTSTDDTGPSTLRDAVTASNRTIVFDISGTIFLQTPLIITNSFLTIAGQTSPDGITVIGSVTTFTNLHDVIIRDVRFHSTTNLNTSTGFEEATGDFTVGQVASGWTVLSNQVSVMADSSTANDGNNYLTLASGVISTNVSLTVGRKYTVQFVYRGPGAAGMWRGENNAVDSIYGNNGTTQNVFYEPGTVGNSFTFSNSITPVRVSVADDPRYVLTTGLTIEGWIRPKPSAGLYCIFWRGDNRPGLDPYSMAMNGANTLGFSICDSSGTSATADSVIPYNTWCHAVGVYDGQSVKLYTNGVLAKQVATSLVPIGNLIAGDHPGVGIGNLNDGVNDFPFNGDVDEISLYSRALSASEAKAIYNFGSTGKFENSTAFPTNLAKATVNMTGMSAATLYGNNTNWQTYSVTFTATNTQMTVKLTGLEPGFLIDSFKVATSTDLSGTLRFDTVSNVVADHVSATWNTNVNLAVTGSTNVTVQWSVIADNVYDTNNPQAMGSLLRTGSGGLTFHHNLYADNYTANPRLGDNLSLDFVNNVVYNWGTNSVVTADDSADNPGGYTNRLNLIANYFITGPSFLRLKTPYTNTAFWGGTSNSWIFITNNFVDSNTNHILDGSPIGLRMLTNKYTLFDRPFPTPLPSIDEAFVAYERVLDLAGANMRRRDWVDTNVVGKVRAFTNSSTIQSPGVVAWWKGEGNQLDSSGYGNDATTSAGVAYTAGAVGTAFSYDGATTRMTAPASSSMAVTNFTIETWVYSTDQNTARPIVDYGQAGQASPIHFWINTVGGFSVNPGGLHAVVRGPTSSFEVDDANLRVPTNQWVHIAFTYSITAGGCTGILYCNGVQIATASQSPAVVPSSLTSVNIGYRDAGSTEILAGRKFQGLLDEVTIYNRVLSDQEIFAIYNTRPDSLGLDAKYPSTRPYLDTDQDGIPDFWETTFGTDPFTPGPTNDRNGDGYTDLEEFNNWLADLHALAVTNTPVTVDLVEMFGQTGHLGFAVTNPVNGSVYVTNVFGAATNTSTFSNRYAVFTPTANYSGYASFNVFVTNADTVASFGPSLVSVAVSAVPVTYNSNMPPLIITLTNGISYTNFNVGGSDFYKYTVSTNAKAVVFEALNPSANVTLVARYGLPLPSLSSFDYRSANGGTANEQILVVSNSTPVALTNGDWYLAVVNVSGGPVTYAARATELLNVYPPLFLYPTNNTYSNIETTPFTITAVGQDTNTPTLALTYAIVTNVLGSTNIMTINPSTGVINWTPDESQGPSTNFIAVSVSNGAYKLTNSFTVIVEESNLPPVLPFIPDQTVFVPGTMTITNTATDVDIPTNDLGYILAGPTNAVISTSGIITWTPLPSQAGGTYVFTTVVTDTNIWAVNAQSLRATNTFVVTVPAQVVGGQPQTNTVPAGSTSWLVIHVPTNAIAATNDLLFAVNLPVNVWFSTNTPPSVTNFNDYLLLSNATNGISVLTTNSTPHITPGGTYFLGVQNTNGVAVIYAMEVDFAFATAATPTNTITFSGIIYTNGGFLLIWYAPTNDTFQVQESPDLTPPQTWNTFSNIIAYTGPPTPTNGLFTFFDDGSQYPFGAFRVYRLLLLSSPNTLTLPGQTNYSANVSQPMVVTNTATDSNGGAILAYSLANFPNTSPVATISTNGIISWTPGTNAAGSAFKFTTIVSDNGLPVAHATNAFTVFVLPAPGFNAVLTTGTNTTFTWTAPTNDLFHVEWTTNLAAPTVWTPFPQTITSATGTFTFTDTNAPLVMEFYRLVWLPLP